MDFGEKIKQMRTLLNLTQEELANRCELTKSYISQLENNKTSPSLATLEVILEVLGTNFSDFFSEEKEPQIVFTKEEQFIKSLNTMIPSRGMEWTTYNILDEYEAAKKLFNELYSDYQKILYEECKICD